MAVHVVDSVDLQLARDIENDPFEAFETHMDLDPFWANSGDFYEGGFWVIGKFDQCREMLQDAELFTSEVFTEEPLLPSYAQPPELQKLRQVLLPHLSRKKTVAAEGRVRELANLLHRRIRRFRFVRPGRRFRTALSHRGIRRAVRDRRRQTHGIPSLGRDLPAQHRRGTQ